MKITEVRDVNGHRVCDIIKEQNCETIVFKRKDVITSLLIDYSSKKVSYTSVSQKNT